MNHCLVILIIMEFNKIFQNLNMTLEKRRNIVFKNKGKIVEVCLVLMKQLI